MPFCSIVIRSYNEQEHIGRLLSGILQQTVDDIEIIVVDSGSTDATLTVASHHPVKILRIEPENFSFGRSLNLGCSASRCDVIVICSGHVYPVHQDWLEQLVAPFADAEVALVYGKQRGNQVTRYSEHQVFARWFPDESNANQTHPFCNNANAAIRRSLWDELRYNEELTGLEDLDWAKRALERKKKIVYVAEAEVVHVHEESPKRIYNRYRREAIALKTIMPEEHLSFREVLRLVVKNIASDYYHAWHDRILLRNLYSIPMFRLMQFCGGYRGFAQRGLVTSKLKRTFYYPRGRKRSKPTSGQMDNRPAVDYKNLAEFDRYG